MGCCGAKEGGAPQVVVLDPRHSGPKVIISSFAVSGSGTALASCAVEQERAYWEVRVLVAGTIAIGVSQMKERKELNNKIGDGRSWGVDLSTGGENSVNEDDIIGIEFDQSEKPVLRFRLNGEEMPDWTVEGMKGTVYPAVFVGDGAICDCMFTAGLFDYPLPPRFSAIIPMVSLI